MGRDSYQGKIASETIVIFWYAQPHPDLCRLFRGEFGLSGGGIAILKVVHNERLSNSFGNNRVFSTHNLRLQYSLINQKKTMNILDFWNAPLGRKGPVKLLLSVCQWVRMSVCQNVS